MLTTTPSAITGEPPTAIVPTLVSEPSMEPPFQCSNPAGKFSVALAGMSPAGVFSITSHLPPKPVPVDTVFVVVVNAEKVVVTGKKESAKTFMSYSGWKGGEKFTTVEQVRARHPERLITHAVKGMLPKNRLGDKLLTKLKVYTGTDHPHKAQQPATLVAGK